MVIIVPASCCATTLEMRAFERRRAHHGDRAPILAERGGDVRIRLAAGAVDHVPAEAVLAGDLAEQIHGDGAVDRRHLRGSAPISSGLSR